MENGFPSSSAQEFCLFKGSYLEAELNLVLLHPSWGHTEGSQIALAQTMLGSEVGRNLQACSPVLATRDSWVITILLWGHAQGPWHSEHNLSSA